MKNRLTPKVMLPFMKENFGTYEITKKEKKAMKQRMKRGRIHGTFLVSNDIFNGRRDAVENIVMLVFIHPLLVFLQSFIPSKHRTKKDVDRHEKVTDEDKMKELREDKRERLKNFSFKDDDKKVKNKMLSNERRS